MYHWIEVLTILVEKYVETYGCKEGEENNGLYVLDLGSGTGETTEALAMVGINTLLFLNTIEEITWDVECRDA